MILRIQHTLSRLGYEPGPLDGDMGRRTRAAIKAAERDMGLRNTGQPSGVLLALLDRRVARVVYRRLTLDAEMMERICGTFPAAHLDHLRAALVEICATPMVAAHFIAQLAHESDRFRALEEYASGEAYEGRASLGNTEPGDGVRYKGRGVIQLTGRANYARMGAYLGVDLERQPGLAARPAIAYQTAAAYWLDRNINGPAEDDNVRAVTKLINGGTSGLADRKKHLRRAKEVLRLTIT